MRSAMRSDLAMFCAPTSPSRAFSVERASSIDVAAAGGEHLGAAGAHGAVGTENDDSLDVDHTRGCSFGCGVGRNAKA